MKKIQYINRFWVLLALIELLTNCSKQTDVQPITTTTTTANYTDINNWVYSVMDDAYFWYSQMPKLASLNATQNPTDFFGKLLYQPDNLDRFSDITDDIDALNNEFQGINKVFGIRYILGYTDATQANIGLFLSYVVKGSPADIAGLKRGDIILKVSGQQLTATNYSTLLSSSETLSFTLGKIDNGSIVTDNSLSITKAEIAEDPVAFSTVVEKPAFGKTVGYLVYTQFVPGLESGDQQKYDNELRQIFANFKSKGVNELVLDLRFNPGGYISSANTLASLIGKDVSASKVFYQEQWNDKYQTYFKSKYGSDYFNHKFQAEANNIGSNLSRVFVLTSQGTASASELVINGLRPYMNVVTIGDHTYGKNLFGTLIEDDQSRWKWGLYVMLGQTSNANGESSYGTVNGIAANYAVDDNTVPFKAFGDDNEPLFKKALNVMGITVGANARLEATQSIERISKEHLAESPKLTEKRMIVKDVLKKLSSE